MNKRLQNIIDLYENIFKVSPLKNSGAFTLLTDDGVTCGVFATEEDAIKAMPVIWYNSRRGYVPRSLLKAKPAFVRFNNNRKQNSQSTRK